MASDNFLLLPSMQHGICLLSVVPCRSEPSGKSEMVTQLLFGEHYTLLGQEEDWLRIRHAYDGYECWISAKQHSPIPESLFKELEKQEASLCSELVQIVHNKLNFTSFPITIGATLPLLKQHSMEFGNSEFRFDGPVTRTGQKKNAEEIINTGLMFLNAPYLWGGKSPFGIDCSGFTQITWKVNGYKLPRDAWQQVELGQPLSFVEEAQAGDLAFFDNEDGRIVHVGILLNNTQILHASGCVRIDNFDHYGIFNTDTRKYSHTLRVIKRIVGEV